MTKKENIKNKEHKHIKTNSFIMINAFMVSELNLKGNDLLIYAIIHGFSHSNGGSFTGSLQYLAEWTNSSKQAVMNSLKKLESDGLISKTEYLVNSVKNCSYKIVSLEEVCKKVGYPMQESCIGMQLSCTNNIEYNIDNKINNINIISDETDNKQDNNVCLNVSNNINSGNCTFQGESINKKGLNSNPKKEAPKDELKTKFREDFKKIWADSGKEKLTKIGFVAINNLYEKYGYDKACHIRDYVMQVYNSNEKSIAFGKHHENALAFYQDPNDEQPRFMNRDEFKYMERTYGKDYNLPQQGDFFKEEPYYAALEWYFSRDNSPNEVVKKTREITSKNLKYKNY